MAKGLERDLGLYAVFTISIGAMIGSGIFVLPGLGAKITGPSIMVAFLLAGLIVLPAALSQSEMATAMPEAGGAYLYIDRAMGPLMGTVAGFGVWFSLVFKAAFALAGLGAYLVFLADIPGKGIALGLATLLIILNVLGAKKTGGAQAFVVTAVLAAIVFFIVTGVPEVDTNRLDPFLAHGFDGLITAAAVVFVSYAGVTNIASVAEEVKNPKRNIPMGILLSISIMLILYPAIVYVMVGVTPLDTLSGSDTPVATAAEQFLGSVGVDVIAVVAVLALTGMANAGLLSSSRYPFAMSRNSLAPGFFMRIGSRGTPVYSILVTGGILLALVAFVPLIELAKLASAFQLLIMSFINLALIAFRESKLEWYRPSFKAPFYPWIQIFGIVAAGALLSQMGAIPILGAVAIVVGGVFWYRGFGRSRATRESAVLDALRVRSTGRLVSLTTDAIASGGKSHILIPVLRNTRRSRMRDLVRIASHLVAPEGRIEVVEFEPADARTVPSWTRGVGERTAGVTDVVIEFGDIASPDPASALLSYARENDVDLVLSEFPRETRATRRFINEMKDMRDHLEADSIFLRNRSLGQVGTIAIMGSGGPYDVFKISLATRIARAEGSRLRFIHVLPEDATDAQVESVDSYHNQLQELVDVETESVVARAADLIPKIDALAAESDLVVIGAATHRVRLFGDLADRIADSLEAPVMMVHTRDFPRPTWLEATLERLIY